MQQVSARKYEDTNEELAYRRGLNESAQLLEETERARDRFKAEAAAIHNRLHDLILSINRAIGDAPVEIQSLGQPR